jgi:tRNA(Arg) A34 adenosine deaminase TadA
MQEDDRDGFIREAIRLAAESVSSGGGPFGAVVVKDGRIIARGRNRVTETNDPTAHAEILAIREACRILGTFQLTGCEVYCSGEPCPMCLGALYWARPEAVYFANGRDQATAAGFDDSFIYEEILRPPEERTLFTRRLEVGGADEAYELWRELDDRVEY